MKNKELNEFLIKINKNNEEIYNFIIKGCFIDKYLLTKIHNEINYKFNKKEYDEILILNNGEK